MNTITFDNALDVVEQLPYEQKEELVDIMKKRLIDERRVEIVLLNIGTQKMCTNCTFKIA
ncbi:MAG: hypothetical protein FJ218_10095 [Ignavibacteria bacterium]|nr:hypothetical protein [Ignavibacteria bacterium]